MRGGPGRGVARLAGAALLVAAVAACEVDAELNITVEDDGSGVVEVGVGLDDEAVARGPDLETEVELDDLIESGWEITGPTREADGRTWLRAEHPFSNPDEVDELVADVVGEDGMIRDVGVARVDEFAESRWTFDAVVDFVGGLGDALADQDVDDALAAEGLPPALEVIGDRIEEAVDETVKFRVAVRLPGDVESNAPTQAGNGAVWRPSLTADAPIELQAEGTVANTSRLVWAAVGAAAAFGLLLFLLVRLALVVRRRRA